MDRETTTAGRTGRRLATIALAVALLASAACGDDSDGGADGAATTQPTETTAPDGAETTEPTETTEPGETGTTEPDASGDPLGPIDEAEGEPVKVGFIFDGQSVSTDASYQEGASEAMVAYINERRGGFGGRPIEMVACVAGQADEAKASGCANELIQAGVVATLLPESTATATAHRIMSEQGIPIITFSIADLAVVEDPENAFVLANPFSAQWNLPASVAQEEGFDTMTAVVIDVPAATELYTTPQAEEFFENAGIEVNMVRVPPGQADMTPQMAQVANGGPTHVHIVGGEAFCIAALNGLKASAFEGSISVINICATETTAEAVGDIIEGAYIATATPVGDPENPDFQLWQAINEHYEGGVEEHDMYVALSTFATWLGTREALDGLEGEVTPESIKDAFHTMDNEQLPGTNGLWFRCNGKARPDRPAVCARGTLSSTLDAQAQPQLPWTLVGNEEIPD